MRHESTAEIDQNPQADVADAGVDARIADFLDGRTHGETLLHALYDHVLDEPIPERMRALLGG